MATRGLACSANEGTTPVGEREYQGEEYPRMPASKAIVGQVVGKDGQHEKGCRACSDREKEQKQARHDEAKQNLARSTALFNKQLISAFDLDKTSADYQNVLADLTAAQQHLSQVETTLSYATLTAPIDGLIVDRFAEPGDTAQAGSKLLSLYNPLSLRVEAQVREKLAMTLKQSQKISIELPSIGKNMLGEIEEIVPAANTGSRSFLVKARIINNENLLPGMYARILIPTSEQTTLNIPQDKVAHIGQLDFVWVKVNNSIQRRFVRLGKLQPNDMVKVISGLNAGDEIIPPQHPSLP